MRRLSLSSALFVCLCFTLVPSSVFSGQVVSTMRNVRAYMEINGYRLQPAPDLAGQAFPGDHAPAQAFELVRPNGEAVKIGRLFTSCTCVRLEAPKNSFARGERAVFMLRNVLPTPAGGQTYAMYIQVTRPIRTTLRYDTFVQSAVYAPMADAPLIIEDVVEKPEEPVVPAEVKTDEESAVERNEPSTPEPEKESEDNTARAVEVLKVTEVEVSEDGPEDGSGEMFDAVDDSEVDDYVSKFLEAQTEDDGEDAPGRTAAE